MLKKEMDVVDFFKDIRALKAQVAMKLSFTKEEKDLIDKEVSMTITDKESEIIEPPTLTPKHGHEAEAINMFKNRAGKFTKIHHHNKIDIIDDDCSMQINVRRS